MRKRIESVLPMQPALEAESWLDLESIAEVEVTSEDPAHPIEGALLPGRDRGWKASAPGPQTLRMIFDSPQELRRVHLVFTESEKARTQEFVLRWSSGKGHPFREVVRQQYNFSAMSREVEDYTVELPEVKILELEIIPSISGGECRASLNELRLR